MQEVGGQKVVVAEDHLDPADGAFQVCGLVQKPGEAGQVAGLPVPQRGGIVAQDLEHPEGQRRAAQVARHVAVGADDQGQRLVQQVGIAQVGGGHRAPLDEVDHQRTGFVVAGPPATPRRHGRRGWRQVR